MFCILWRILTTIRNPWVYAWNRLGKFHGAFRYKLWNGMTVVSRPFAIDRTVLNDVWIDLSYEPNAYGIPFDWKRCRQIVDIGANTGTFSLYAAWKAPQATIHAVEPEPGNLEILKENIAANGLKDRIRVYPVAAGAAESTLNLYVAHHGAGGHSLYKYTDDSHAVTVPVQPLSHVLSAFRGAPCDFLKIDCEGAEYDILYALSEEEFALLPFMAIEFHHFADDARKKPQPLMQFLRDRGYTVREHRKSLCFAFREKAR